jgi:hypothetical protein
MSAMQCNANLPFVWRTSFHAKYGLPIESRRYKHCIRGGRNWVVPAYNTEIVRSRYCWLDKQQGSCDVQHRAWAPRGSPDSLLADRSHTQSVLCSTNPRADSEVRSASQIVSQGWLTISKHCKVFYSQSLSWEYFIDWVLGQFTTLLSPHRSHSVRWYRKDGKEWWSGADLEEIGRGLFENKTSRNSYEEENWKKPINSSWTASRVS